jgi:hypothetical protein
MSSLAALALGRVGRHAELTSGLRVQQMSRRQACSRSRCPRPRCERIEESTKLWFVDGTARIGQRKPSALALALFRPILEHAGDLKQIHDHTHRRVSLCVSLLVGKCADSVWLHVSDDTGFLACLLCGRQPVLTPRPGPAFRDDPPSRLTRGYQEDRCRTVSLAAHGQCPDLSGSFHCLNVQAFVEGYKWNKAAQPNSPLAIRAATNAIKAQRGKVRHQASRIRRKTPHLTS